MRYRRLSYRYAMVVRSGQTWPFDDIWQSDRLRLLVQPRWRPDADTYETATTVEIVVDLAGVDEDDFEVQLFEDALVVEGRRRLPACRGGRRVPRGRHPPGPVPAGAAVAGAGGPERVEARYDRGLLRITLPKRAEAALMAVQAGAGPGDFADPRRAAGPAAAGRGRLPADGGPARRGPAALGPARRRRHARQPAPGAGGAARPEAPEPATPDDLHRIGTAA